MAELRESFPSLEDSATGAGVPITKTVTGDSATGKVGPTVFGFRDSSGNVILPQLDSAGRLPVSTDDTGTFLKASGSLAAGSATLVDITLATVALTTSKIYSRISVTVSCFRDSYFEVQQIDNLTTTVLCRMRLGSGLYTFSWVPAQLQFSSGATGTQTLKVQGMNLNTLSEMDANISVVQIG